MNHEKTLEIFGLSKSKAHVYLAALTIGRGTVIDIALQAQLPRTTTHEILMNLTSLGLVKFTVKGRRRIYIAEKPTQLKKILEDKQHKLETALPSLMSLWNTTGIKPQVLMYEGVQGIKTVFEDTLTVKNKTLYGILSMEDLYSIPGKSFMDAYIGKRVHAGISLKVIRSEGKEIEPTWPTSNEELRELRYAPKNLTFPMTTYLYDNKVAIIGTQKENFGMIIESADFYTTLKNLFDILWSVSKII